MELMGGALVRQTPGDVLELQARWSDYWATVKHRESLRKHMHCDYKTKARHLREASTYLIRENMCHLLCVAVPQMPSYTLEISDLPDWHGFVVLERPTLIASGEAGSMGIGAFSWMSPTNKPDGVLFSIYTSTDGRQLMFAFDWYAEFGAFDIKERALVDDWLGLMLCVFALLRQRLPVIHATGAERSARRRIERSGYEKIAEHEVRVIDLRALDYKSDNCGSRAVDWSHRWMVSGHWRKQWYPGDQVHRPKWIMSYVKGPEDKPLQIKPTVHVLRR